MGGLALKHLGVQRVNRSDYFKLLDEVAQFFWDLDAWCIGIKAYRTKESFGDADVLILPDQLPEDWLEKLCKHFNSKGFVKNGPVTSVEIKNFQFDFIATTLEKWHKAFVYFSYNDLGNLMGRVAHKMGFKYGHEGLKYVLRDENEDHILAEISIDATAEDVFAFLGYSYEKWQRGFDTLEDVFKFTASSIYFSPEIYLLHNRNHVSRVRDAKRKTYTEFLEWCEKYPRVGYNCDLPKDILKQEHLLRAFDYFPKLEEEIQKELEKARAKQELKKIWNGDNVMQWTGLQGKELGAFMKAVESLPLFSFVCDNREDLEHHVKQLNLKFKVKV